MQEVLTHLLHAQAIDQRLSVLQRRLDSLPVETAERQASLSALEVELEQAIHERKTCLARANELENQVLTREERIDRLEKQAVESRDPAAAQVARHEAGELRKANSTDQEEALEALERAEALEKDRQKEEEAVNAAREDLEGFQAQADQDAKELQAEVDSLRLQIDKELEAVGSQRRGVFETLAKRYPGKAVVSLKGDSCGGCGTRLVMNDQVRVKAMKSIIRCPSCTRILIPAEVLSAAAEEAEEAS